MTITEIRQAIAVYLGAATVCEPVEPYWPATPRPGGLFVRHQSGSKYFDTADDDGYCGRSIALSVLVVSPVGESSEVQAWLDDQIVAVWDALDADPTCGDLIEPVVVIGVPDIGLAQSSASQDVWVAEIQLSRIRLSE